MKIFADTLPIKQPQWCWRREWSTGYDSSFGLLMKFAMLNALTARDVAKQFLSRKCGHRTALLRSLDIDLRDHQLFDLQAIADALQIDVAVVAASFPTADWAHMHCSATNLKWCELCLAWGLHLPITQMHMVTQCPIHKLPLLSKCIVCDASIPFTICASTFEEPFKCPSCDVDLATRLRRARSWVPALRDDQAVRIRLMQKYVAVYSSLTAASQVVPTITGHCTSLRMLPSEKQQSIAYLDFIGQVVDEISSKDEQRSLPLTKISKTKCGCGCDDSVHEHFSPGAIPEVFLTAEEMQIATTVYRAIRRRLWRLLGSHRFCVTTACRHFWWDMRGARSPSFCEKASTYIRWRMLWEGRGTPRYLDTPKKNAEYYGILGWLQARPAPYPEDWTVVRKEWLLAHIFSNVCLASYGALAHEAGECAGLEMTWDAIPGTTEAVTHWVLANADSRDDSPIIFTPVTRILSGTPAAHRSSHHRAWHMGRLEQSQR